MVAFCNSTNSVIADQETFWDIDGTIHWDAHRIGWSIAGGCAAVCTLVTLIGVLLHATHYQNRDQQRQVIRVLLMPMVYAIVSFFSYRFFRDYTYYAVAEAAYESICLSAFMMLMVHMVRQNNIDNLESKDLQEIMKAKDKRKMPFPFGRIRFRASKPYFLYSIKWSVLQYVILRPLISIVGIICQAYNVLCPEEYSSHFAGIYLDVVDFISLSVALYGLVVFYVLCKDELKGRKPLAKFMGIKMIVFFTFYQAWLFGILQSHGVIKGTAYWTATNVAEGLSALCTCVEMLVFSLYMLWAYPYKEYTNLAIQPIQRVTGCKTFCQAFWDTVNLADFAVEIWESCRFFFDYIRGVPYTRSRNVFDQAFIPQPLDETALRNPQDLSLQTTVSTLKDPFARTTDMIDPQEKYRLESSPPVDTGVWQNTEYPESHTGYTRHQGDPYGREAAEPSVQPQQLAGAWHDGGARYNVSEHVDGRGRV